MSILGKAGRFVLRLFALLAWMLIAASFHQGMASNVWTGESGAYIDDGGNWLGGNTPDLLSGNQTLEFGTGGTVVFVNSITSAKGLVLNLETGYQFQIDTANGISLTVGSAGIVATSPSPDTSFNFFDLFSVSGDQTWSISNSSLVIKAGFGGDFTITKNGSGSVVLEAGSSRSSASAGVVLSGGVLKLQDAAALNTSPDASLILSGGALILANDNNTIFLGTNTTVSGNSRIETTSISSNIVHPLHSIGDLRIGSQTLTVAVGEQTTAGTAIVQTGAVTLTGNAVFQITRETGQEMIFRLASVDQSGGTRGFLKSGNGTLGISGASSYTGTTTLSGGTLAITNSNALGGSGNITFSGGTLQFGSGAAPDLSARIRNSSSAIAIDTNGENATFSSAINASNTQGFTKLGVGSINFSGNNTYNGTTTVRSGTIRYMPGGVFDDPWGADSNLVVGATSGDNGFFAVAGGYVRIYDLILGNGTSTNGTLSVESGNFTANHNLFVASASNSRGVFHISGGDVAWTYALGVGYFGSGNLTMTGGNLTGASGAAPAGQLKIGWYSGSNGSLVMSGGAISASDSSIGEASGSRGIATISGGNWTTSGNFSIGVSGNAALEISGSGRVVVGGTLSRNATRGSVALQNGGTLQIGNGGSGGVLATDLTNNGTLVFDRTGSSTHSNLISGTGALTKNGSGSLSLIANNTYSGGTQVNGGTLLISGSLASANSSIVVAEGATLGGTGVVGRSVQINGGLSPGNSSVSTGNFTISGNLNLSSNASIAIGLNGTIRGANYDALNVGGSLACGGTLHFEIGGAFLSAGQSFQIFNTTGNTTSGFSEIVFSGAYGSGNFTNAGGGNWTRTVDALNLSYSETTGVLSVASAVAPPTITSAATASGTAGSSFLYQTTVTPAVPTSYIATGLPSALSMNSTSGLISGTPDAGGNSTVTIVATNSGGSSGNFSLSINVAPAPTAYETWATSYGLTGADSLPSADPDEDGFTNRQEYSFGTNPVIPTGALLSTSTVGGNLVVSFCTRLDQNYDVQTTSNLSTSAFSNNSTLTNSVSVSGNQSGVEMGYLRKEFSITPSGERNFYRVLATD